MNGRAPHGRSPPAYKKAAGPLIVEEYDATCVVPPGARASLDGFGNIVVEMGAGNRA